MFIAQAIRFNNEAIAALQRGASTAAVDNLKRALAIMMEESDRVSQREQGPGYAAPPVLSTAESIQSAPILSASNPLTKTLSSQAEEDDLFLMYPRPFEIVLSSPLVSEAQIGFHRCLVVILYNLAFAFDILALAKDGVPEFHARCEGWRAHALKLYRLALQVTGASTKPEIDSMKCLLLATSNNLGRLSHVYEDTKDCLRMSLDLLGNQETVRQMSPEDYELLFGSLAPFLCVKDYLLPVAAAA